MNNLNSFVDDKEKVRDLLYLSKEEFLESYSYIEEAEYENTVDKILKYTTARKIQRDKQNEARHADIDDIRKKQLEYYHAHKDEINAKRREKYKQHKNVT